VRTALDGALAFIAAMVKPLQELGLMPKAKAAATNAEYDSEYLLIK